MTTYAYLDCMPKLVISKIARKYIKLVFFGFPLLMRTKFSVSVPKSE